MGLMNRNDPSFQQLQVAAFENHRPEAMEHLIRQFGGRPSVSPSVRAVPLADSSAVVDFANRLITGQVDVVVLTTASGVRHLLEAIERHVDAARFLQALSDATTVACSARVAKAMREVDLQPTHCVDAPNTWQEILATIDKHVPVANQTVAIQEHGPLHPGLVAGLEARGANVLPLKVYDLGLPADTGPLEDNVFALAGGEIGVALFTSPAELRHLLAVAEHLGLVQDVTRGLREAVVGATGSGTTQALRELRVDVDAEPDRPGIEHLVRAAAERCTALSPQAQEMVRVSSHPSRGAGESLAPWHESPFMRACRREPCDVTPVWLMRQAGRYMAEYREIREKTTFLKLCKQPDLCAEIMLTAVTRLGVDAAIIFSDLLLILEPMGLDLQYAKGEGPVIHNPVRGAEDVDRVLELSDVQSLDYVMETVRRTRADLPAAMPLIGFAGAPFTLASYAIEGGSSRSYLHTKKLMYGDPGAWRALMQRFVRAITGYLNAQIAAGCQCVQLFDSWAGCLSPDDYREFVLPHVAEIIAGITPGVPVINFATGNPALLPHLAAGGGDVIGVDWRIRLDSAWEIVGHDRAVQGNLDPTTLLADREVILRRTKEVLDQAAGRPGHIFNLGHGVLQQTPVDHAIALVDAVHELSSGG